MYTLEYRRVTKKKGTPKEVNVLRHLSEDELLAELAQHLEDSMWLYIEDENRMSAPHPMDVS